MRTARWPTPLPWIAAGLYLALAVSITTVVVGVDRAPLGIDLTVWEGTGDTIPLDGALHGAAETLGRVAGPLGSSAVVVVVVLLLWGARQTALAMFMALTGILGVAVSESVKHIVARPRPPGAAAYVTDTQVSFPSGHTMTGIYVYGAIGLLLILWGLDRNSTALRVTGFAFFGFGIVVGLSRIVLGVHWASDVMAGWLFGGAVLLGVAAAMRPDDAILGRQRDQKSPPVDRGQA